MPVKVGVYIICKLYAFIIAGYCLIPFATLRFYRWWPIYKEFYFFGHIIILPMTLVWKPLVLKMLYVFFPLDKEVKASNVENEDKKNEQHEKSN
jgi:hypothetical protein